MMKRIALGVALATLALATSGYMTFSSHRLTGGPYGRYYWLDGSVDSTLATEVYDAKRSWGLATSKIALAETSSEGASTFQVFQSNTIYNAYGVCALTKWVDASGNVNSDPRQRDWSEVRILVSPEAKNGTSQCSNSQGIVAHEFGHAFGLAHVDSPTVALMRTDIHNLPYTVPKSDDITGIDHLY